MDEVNYLAGPSVEKINVRLRILPDSYIYSITSIWHHLDSPPTSTGSSSILSHPRISPSSTSSPLDNRALSMVNTSQAPDLEGIIHHKIHGNEINVRLVQHLTTTNPPPPTVPVPEAAKRPRHSHRLSNWIPKVAIALTKGIKLEAIAGQVRQKNASYLFIIHQKDGESLKDYIKCFNQAVLEVKDPSDKVVVMAMMERLRPGPLFDSLFLERPKNHVNTPEGYLRKFVVNCMQPKSPDRRYGDNGPPVRDIQTIHGGFGSIGCLSSSQKRHEKETNGRAEKEVYNLSTPLTEAQQAVTSPMMT
ncbi:hypothetical protein Acr_00g0045140 [Actinidia rufa]|uniref:Uncharacterized protein n=1 Tax=Actinidia rufa TaxID=165716 RepID=A0A7J0DJ27_9ERIC|nr:hypothetical protein Acr_00g0045140 [Actinidia rufa]